MLKLLSGSAPNARDERGETLLHKVDAPQLVAALLRTGADPHARNYEGETPLQCLVDQPEIAEVLREWGGAETESGGGASPSQARPASRESSCSHAPCGSCCASAALKGMRGRQLLPPSVPGVLSRTGMSKSSVHMRAA